MAITQAGTTLRFDLQVQTNSGTVSSTITVPSDAEIVLVGVSTWATVANYLTSGSMTFTKNSVDTTMTAVTGGDSNTGMFYGTIFYLLAPDTGTNKSLKWDWSGTTTMVNYPLFSITFWRGIDTSSPVRHSGGSQASALPYTTPTLTAQSGDLIVAWAHGFAEAEGSVDSWSNLTLLSQLAKVSFDSSDGAWATGSPSGNTTVGASTGTNWDDGGISAVVLKPATSSSSISSSYYYRMLNG